VTIEDLFQHLAGSWQLARRIHPEGELTGTAVFTPRDDGGLDYFERGELHLPTGSFHAERRYIFRPDADGFSVEFADGTPRPFHTVRLERGEDGCLGGEAPHLCGRDLYMTAYRFLPDGTFAITNRVSGPNKDYAVVSTYSRATAQEIAA
jgi:hypothetical protein